VCYNNDLLTHLGYNMNLYEIWVCINGRQVTTHVQLRASDFITAQQIAEAQYGAGNVLNVRQLSD